MKLKFRLALFAFAILAAAPALADRPQSYAIRDVVAGDIRSVCIVAIVDEQDVITGLREEWTFETYTTGGEPQGMLSEAQILAPGAPGTAPIMNLMNNRLPKLNERLDAKYPPSGVPVPLGKDTPSKPRNGNGGGKP